MRMTAQEPPGTRQDSATVGTHLKDSFDQIREATDLLADRCKDRIEKAWRVTEKMTATIAFFFYMIESFVNKMDLPENKRELMHNRLIPGFYLQKIAQKEKDPEQKEKIRQRSQELLSVLKERNGPLSESDDCKIDRMVRTAKECAGLFQRSSSCVEGRNAQLSLHHHGMHRLSDRKMKGLTLYITSSLEVLPMQTPDAFFYFILDSSVICYKLIFKRMAPEPALGFA